MLYSESDSESADNLLIGNNFVVPPRRDSSASITKKTRSTPNPRIKSLITSNTKPTPDSGYSSETSTPSPSPSPSPSQSSVLSSPATSPSTSTLNLKLDTNVDADLVVNTPDKFDFDFEQEPAYHNPRLDPKNYLDGPLSQHPATRLRQMLARPGIVVAPGVCDGISARCALEAGFECLYQSGAATTASRLGQPDVAIATLNDFVQSGQMISSLSPSTPIIADADTGFGGPANIARTVSQYARAGLAALHIEDQIQTKRCGHLLGKSIVPLSTFLARIRAAVHARDQLMGSGGEGQADFVVIARTDSAQVLGMEEAVRRLRAAAWVGADVCFIEGVKSAELLDQTVRALAPKPVLVNVISGGLTPSFTYHEAEALGAKIIIFSLVSAVASAHALRAAMRSLKETGTDFVSAQGMDPRAFFELMGLEQIVDIDRKAGGSAFKVV